MPIGPRRGGARPDPVSRLRLFDLELPVRDSVRAELQGGEDVCVGEVGVFGDELGLGGASRELAQEQLDRNARPADDGLAHHHVHGHRYSFMPRHDIGTLPPPSVNAIGPAPYSVRPRSLRGFPSSSPRRRAADRENASAHFSCLPSTPRLDTERRRTYNMTDWSVD